MNVHGSSPPAPGDRFLCPDCRTPVELGLRICAQCGLLLHGPEAQNLWRIDNRIAELHSRAQALRAERSTALQDLRRASWFAAAAPAPPSFPIQDGPSIPESATPARPASISSVELTPRSAQNVVLGLGALLVGVAALVFAVWTWGDLGTGARAGVLGLVTLTAAGGAIPLHRRGLHATAETFGVLAVALLCIDAFALWAFLDRITNTSGYTAGYAAGALTIIAALLFTYPLIVPLRGPRPIAVVLVQSVPLLLVVSLPISFGVWVLAVLAGTALVDALVVLKRRRPDTEVPVGTIRGCALLVGALATLPSFVVLVLGHSGGHWDLLEWSALPFTFLLVAVTGLLLARNLGSGAGPMLLVSLLLFGTAVLTASGPYLPVLPRGVVEPSSGLLDRTVRGAAVDVLTTGWEEPFLPLGALYLTAVAVTAALSVGAVFLLRRDLLVPLLALIAPPALLSIPLLTGVSYVITVMWTVLVGAALVLGVAVIRDGTHARVPVITGIVTLLTGFYWSMLEPGVFLAVLVVIAATGLVSVLLSRRTAASGGEVKRPARALCVAAGVLTAVTLLAGVVHLIRMRVFDQTQEAQWWLLAATVLLAGATVSALGRARPPFTIGGSTEPRSGLSFAGLPLLAATPLLTGPDRFAIFSPGPVDHGTWQAPSTTMLDPAHVLLDVAVPMGAAAVLGTASGLVAVGALAIGAVRLIDRDRLPLALPLVAPPTLVPLPVVLHSPFLVALCWSLLVGAGLVLCSAARPATVTAPWLPALTGLCTLGLGLSWASVEQYTTVGVLLFTAVVCAVAAAFARSVPVAVGSTAVATAATGGAVFTSPLAAGLSAEYAAFAVIALTAGVAVVAPRLRTPLLEAAEVPAGLWALIALFTVIGAHARTGLVALALALLGVIALAGAVRPGRRFLAVIGGLLMPAALWTSLVAWKVGVIEAYTVPPAIAALVIGWEWTRRSPEEEVPSSWLAHAGGLLLLLLPSTVQVLDGQDLGWRVPVVLAAGLAVVLWGLRARLQAALVLGGLVLVVTSLRAFGPPLWDLITLLPNWVPFAVIGGVLLAVGARYEASLTRLRRLGRAVSAMR